jgi:SAM-dependent methyltransferase
VLALDVLEHCDNDTVAAAEIARVLKPGGWLVATVPALPSLWSVHDEDNAHFRRYTRRTLESVLASSGFASWRITYFNMFLLPVGYASRLAANLTGSRRALGVDAPPGLLNTGLRTVFSLEIPVLRRARLPVGMSLLAVARTSEEPE